MRYQWKIANTKTKKERKQEIMKENEWVIDGSIWVWIQCEVHIHIHEYNEWTRYNTCIRKQWVNKVCYT
jgi:hypothetical protein